MKSTAEKQETRLRLRLLALGALGVGCVVLAAVVILIRRQQRLLIPLALLSSMLVNIIAVLLSRMQQKESGTEPEREER